MTVGSLADREEEAASLNTTVPVPTPGAINLTQAPCSSAPVPVRHGKRKASEAVDVEDSIPDQQINSETTATATNSATASCGSQPAEYPATKRARSRCDAGPSSGRSMPHAATSTKTSKANIHQFVCSDSRLILTFNSAAVSNSTGQRRYLPHSVVGTSGSGLVGCPREEINGGAYVLREVQQGSFSQRFGAWCALRGVILKRPARGRRRCLCASTRYCGAIGTATAHCYGNPNYGIDATRSAALFTRLTGINPRALHITSDVEFFLFMTMRCEADRQWASFRMSPSQWEKETREFNKRLIAENRRRGVETVTKHPRALIAKLVEVEGMIILKIASGNYNCMCTTILSCTRC